MQIFALALMLMHNGDNLSSKVLYNLLLSIPALMARTALGIRAFRTVKEQTFRRIILAILLVSGVLLIM